MGNMRRICYHTGVILSCLALSAVEGQYGTPDESKRRADRLVQQAQAASSSGNKEESLELFESALRAYPYHTEALMQTGFPLMTSRNKSYQWTGIERMSLLWHENAHPSRLDRHTPQSAMLSSVIGRFYMEEKHFRRAREFYKISATSEAQTSHCASIALATLLPSYPESEQAAAEAIARYNRLMDKLLAVPALSMENIADPDAYTFCFATNFVHEIYHDADLRETMSKYYKLAVKALPHLNYTAPFLYRKQTRMGKKIKLGIASAFFTQSSVIGDFGGTLSRLPTDIFEFYYINVLDGEMPSTETPFLDAARAQGATVLAVQTKVPGGDPTAWLRIARQQIETLELDLLLYLDLTMSGKIHQLGMSRLARVQATSHGHPVTSGIDRSVMNYFISWGAAELPLDDAQRHYTERLVLFPDNHVHQYMFKRITPDVQRRSTQDHKTFDHLSRADFAQDLDLPLRANWYLCMQKPFKRMPQFDRMLADVQRRDPQAHVILHDIDEDVRESKEIVRNRLEAAGCDMSRIRMISSQPHHRLLALYARTDVVLDSYQAGGCTTTREALEVGAVVVTLPTRYLGGRWSKAFFDIIGVADTIAKDEEDYARLAVYYGMNKQAQKYMKNLILKKIDKLYHNDEVVNMWTYMLVKMASGELSQDA